MTEDVSKLSGAIGALLASDPICMGRVSMGTIEAIAALLKDTGNGLAEDVWATLDDCRCVIKFHTKPGQCVSRGDRIISALQAHDRVVELLAWKEQQA